MSAETFDVIVVGAGMAGIACAARLRAREVGRFCVLDQGDNVGASWRRRFERLSLNSPFHDLPDDDGLRGRWGMFLHRTELVSYLEEYANLHKLATVMRFRERVATIRRASGSWKVRTTVGTYDAKFVVVATAINRVPRYPNIPEHDHFAGRRIHSCEYWNADPFRDHRVLVVGSGNSAADIALDLVEGAARSVTLWVRAPRHVLSREAFARAARIARRLGIAFTPESLADAHRYTWIHSAWRERLSEQDRFLESFSIDLSRYGIRQPQEGPATQVGTLGREPWYDSGTAREIEAGRIEVVDGTVEMIERFTQDGLRFTTGERPFDAVIFGTGFVPRLEEFIDESEVLCWDDRRRSLVPRTDGRCRSTVQPSMFFPGFDETPYGGMSLGLWGAEVADVVASELKV